MAREEVPGHGSSGAAKKTPGDLGDHTNEETFEESPCCAVFDSFFEIPAEIGARTHERWWKERV